jgi:hypothetical protein
MAMNAERKPNVKAVLALVAAALAAVAIWAGVALGAGSSANESGTADSPQAPYTQTQNDDTERTGEDCPQESGEEDAAGASAAA